MQTYSKQFKQNNDNTRIMRKVRFRSSFNKPAYIGMCILGLGKVLMYGFYYGYIRNKYGKNSRLIFTDTDSLMYGVLATKKKCLTFVIIHLSQNIMIIQTNLWLVK